MDLQEAFDKGFEAVKSYIDTELATLKSREPIPGPPGEAGLTGLTGPIGEKGERGDRGEPGRDGRDAADLALLKNTIAETVATHFTEVIKTLTVTSPDFGRTLVVALGDQVHEIKTAIPLDAGVWKEKIYVAGDAVSHGGSLFIARTATAARPGSDDWRLAVKRGNDGRDSPRQSEARADTVIKFK